MARKKKIATAAVATTLAASLLLGGTFAWQSISQTALNEKEAVINPGGRLHDDFNGTNKDVYVENFATNDIYARVRLDEYFEIVMNKGVEGAETTEVVTEGATKDEVGTYITHLFDADATNKTDIYWEWTTGGSTTYMPTFNKNKDSFVADINGTMDYEDADGNPDPYGDYVDYSKEENKTKTATEIYDGDSNTVDEVKSDFENLDKYADNIKTIENAEHTVKTTGTATLISMAEWLALNGGEYSEATHSNYWVYDTDGWVYWSSPIEAGTATGLLLDEIGLTGVMDDSYYYVINVVAQFITADDLGRDDNTGFYADGEKVSTDALMLLKEIGVEVGSIYFNQSMIGTTETVTIDGAEFYVLAYDDEKDQYLIWSKTSAGLCKFGEDNIWDEDCTAYKKCVEWLESTETLKNYAQETTIKTRVAENGNQEDFNEMTCSVFLLSKSDLFSSGYTEDDYTYKKWLLTSYNLPIYTTNGTGWLRSVYPMDGGYVSAVSVHESTLDEDLLKYSDTGSINPALWVKGL